MNASSEISARPWMAPASGGRFASFCKFLLASTSDKGVKSQMRPIPCALLS